MMRSERETLPTRASHERANVQKIVKCIERTYFYNFLMRAGWAEKGPLMDDLAVEVDLKLIRIAPGGDVESIDNRQPFSFLGTLDRHHFWIRFSRAVGVQLPRRTHEKQVQVRRRNSSPVGFPGEPEVGAPGARRYREGDNYCLGGRDLSPLRRRSALVHQSQDRDIPGYVAHIMGIPVHHNPDQSRTRIPDDLRAIPVNLKVGYVLTVAPGKL